MTGIKCEGEGPNETVEQLADVEGGLLPCCLWPSSDWIQLLRRENGHLAKYINHLCSKNINRTLLLQYVCN